MTFLWVLALPALALEVFPSHARVRAIRFEGGAAVADTAGGALRLEGHSAAPAPVEWGGCRYEAAEEGLRRRCGASEDLLSVGGFPVAAVAVHDGELFAGTFGGGLRRVHGGRVGGVPDAVTALAETDQGLLCGTEDGLYRLSGRALERLDPPSLPDPNVSALAHDGERLWIGSFDGGLASLSSAGWRRWTTADGLPSDWIDDLAWDGEKLWGATEKGVFWIVGGRVSLPRSDDLRRPTSAIHAGAGAVYVAQPRRVLILKADGAREVKVPEAHPQRVWSDGGELWVAGVDGLYRVKGRRVTRYGKLEGSLGANWVTAVAPWEDGLLVGTYDGGLVHLDAAGASRGVLDRAWVNLGALAASRGRVAVGEMEGGLWLHEGGAWRRLKREDGLPSNDVTAVLFQGDDLWVGTREGLARLRMPPAPGS